MKSNSVHSIRGEWEDLADSRPQSRNKDGRNGQNHIVTTGNNNSRSGKRRPFVYNAQTSRKLTTKKCEKNKGRINSKEDAKSSVSRETKRKPKVSDDRKTRPVEQRNKFFNANRTVPKKSKAKMKTRETKQGDKFEKINKKPSPKLSIHGTELIDEREKLILKSETVQKVKIRKHDSTKKITLEIHIRENTTDEEIDSISKNLVLESSSIDKEEKDKREFDLEEKMKSQSRELNNQQKFQEDCERGAITENLIKTLEKQELDSTEEKDKPDYFTDQTSKISPIGKSQSRESDICPISKSSREGSRSPGRKSLSKISDRNPIWDSASMQNIDKELTSLQIGILRVQNMISETSQYSGTEERPVSEMKSRANSSTTKPGSKSNIQNTVTFSKESAVSDQSAKELKYEGIPEELDQNTQTNLQTHTEQSFQSKSQSAIMIDVGVQSKERSNIPSPRPSDKFSTMDIGRKIISKTTNTLIHGQRTQHNIRLLKQVRKPEFSSKVDKGTEVSTDQDLKSSSRSRKKDQTKCCLNQQTQENKMKQKASRCQPMQNKCRYKNRSRELGKCNRFERNGLESKSRIKSSETESERVSNRLHRNSLESEKSFSSVKKAKKKREKMKERKSENRKWTSQESVSSKNGKSTIIKKQSQDLRCSTRCNKLCIGFASDNQIQDIIPDRPIVKSIPSELRETYDLRPWQSSSLPRSRSLPPSEVNSKSHVMHADPPSSFDSFFQELEFQSNVGQYSQMKASSENRETESSVTEKRSKNFDTKRKKLKSSRTRSLIRSTTVTDSQTQTGAAPEPQNPVCQCSDTSEKSNTSERSRG